MLKIYLAGWTGESEYRKYCKEHYGKSFELIDALELERQDVGSKRQDEIILQKHKMTMGEIFTVVTRDKREIVKCDILLAYINKITFGTSMEIMYAYDKGIPIYVVNPSMEYEWDCWLAFHTKSFFPNLDLAFLHFTTMGAYTCPQIK